MEGFRGTASVTPNHADHETTIVYQPASMTERLVFVVQHSDDVRLPAKWSGPARLFLSSGVLALAAENGTAQMFKLPDREIPPSLKGRFPFELIPAYGIARYERKRPAR